MDWLSTDIPAWMAAIAIALASIAGHMRKLYIQWKRDDVTLAEQSARRTIVEQLHEELTRMSAQNLALAGELNKLQIHILELTKQIAMLSAKNSELENEIAMLRLEINRLRDVTTGPGELDALP